MSSTQDDVRAAFESLEKTDTGQETASPPAMAPASTVLPAVLPDTKDAEAKAPADERGTPGPTRDASGRFVSKDEAAKEPAQKQEVQAVTPVAVEVKAPPTPTDAEKGIVALDPTKPPQGWTAPMKEKWASLPEDVRNEVTRREQDMQEGVHRLNQSYEPLRALGNAMQTFEPYFAHIQKPAPQYLKELVPIEQTLALGNPAQKLDMLLQVADKYGVPIRNVLDQAMGGKLNDTIKESHQKFGTPTPLPPQVQQELQQLRSQLDGITNMAAKNELDGFIADTDNHPFFEQVREPMATLLDSGACTTYQEAYDIAVWRNPDLRARAVAQVNGQSQQAGIQQRQAAAAVAVPPVSANIGKVTPKDDGTGDVYDDVRLAWERAAGGSRA